MTAEEMLRRALSVMMAIRSGAGSATAQEKQVAEQWVADYHRFHRKEEDRGHQSPPDTPQQ
jgi:hypothetical protein